MSDPTDLTSPTTPTFSSVIAPYMPSYCRPYERANSTSAVVAMPPTAAYKRQHHRRSLAESDPGTNGAACLDAAGASAAIVRASVLRDGKGRSTTLSPADLTAANYRSISTPFLYFCPLQLLLILLIMDSEKYNIYFLGFKFWYEFDWT